MAAALAAAAINSADAAPAVTTAPVITLATAASVCVPTTSMDYDGDPDPGDRCVVVGFQPIAHTTPRLFYQRQAYLTAAQAQAHPNPQALLDDPMSTDGNGMAVLQAAPGGNTLTTIIGMSGTDAYFDPPPHLQRTPQGPVLLVPASAVASSAPDLSVALRRSRNRWTAIDEVWFAALAKRLPKDVAQWKGGLMDWQHLRARSALWHQNDANCCPTGGSYTAQLRLNGNRLELVWLRISKMGLPE